MENINIAVVSGNLTRDAELRATAGGTQVLGFSLAVNDRRKNPHTGEWEDCPNYIDCVMFGGLAQSLAARMRKGVKACVSGKLRWSSWERDGQRRSKVEVVAEGVELMAQSAPAAPQAARPYQGAPQPVYQPQAAPQPVYQPQAIPQPAAVYPNFQEVAPAPAPQQDAAYSEEIPF